eukprot:TRINITY_DN5523_c0_g1_i1.p1 TRINITY_DN5523_c0_g1~~TRINITY_DN5523_c0_g1_i1.p1  ORF type:complete len:295 (+),score=-20.47 TRINITY_DN5523_c0_g1_i1:1044-1928(+)
MSVSTQLLNQIDTLLILYIQHQNLQFTIIPKLTHNFLLFLKFFVKIINQFKKLKKVKLYSLQYNTNCLKLKNKINKQKRHDTNIKFHTLLTFYRSYLFIYLQQYNLNYFQIETSHYNIKNITMKMYLIIYFLICCNATQLIHILCSTNTFTKDYNSYNYKNLKQNQKTKLKYITSIKQDFFNIVQIFTINNTHSTQFNLIQQHPKNSQKSQGGFKVQIAFTLINNNKNKIKEKKTYLTILKKKKKKNNDRFNVYILIYLKNVVDQKQVQKQESDVSFDGCLILVRKLLCQEVWR